MIEPSLDHHTEIDFQPFRPRQKKEQCPGIFAGDYDLVPNVRNDVVRGSDVLVLEVDRAANR
jgi:hypothetical protein